MELLVPAGIVALVAVPVILVLYILKVRGPEVRVGTLFLWPAHLADRQANAPWKRLRLSWLLLAQLLVAALLALVLMRPGLVGAADVATTTVVLLDGSPSMQATDVAPNRFEEAVSRAGRLVDKMGDGQQMGLVLLGGNARLLAAPTADRRALHAALGRARPAGSAGNLDEGISIANAVLTGRSDASVVLFSDGHLAPTAAAPRSSAPFTYESVGSSGENVAMATLGRTPGGDIFLGMTNVGPSAQDRRVELRADGRLVDVLPVRLEAGSSGQRVWTGLPADTGMLEARLAPGDDLPLDDAAWLVTEAPAPRRVVLVTAGNGFLSKALSLRPDLDVTVVAPNDYKADDYDLSVFDGFVPEGPLPQPALVVDPPEGRGPVTAGPAIDPGGLLPASPSEPLLQYVSLRDVHVRSASSVQPPPEWRTVVAAADGPLLLVHQAQPVAQVNFDLHDSDLPLRAGFPILVQNLVTALLPGGFENQVLPLGQPVSLTSSPGATGVRVTPPGGRTSALPPPYPAVVDDTSRPGVYTVTETAAGRATTSRFVVQLQDPTQSQIAPGAPPLVRDAAQTTGEPARGVLEVWPWLAALALLGLAVEWVLFLRG